MYGVKGFVLLEVVFKGKYLGRKFKVNKTEAARFMLHGLLDRGKPDRTGELIKNDCLLVLPSVEEDRGRYIGLDDEDEDFKEYITDISLNPKKIFRERHNTLEDLLNPAELSIYNSLIQPQNVYVVEEALKKKTEENPNYEVFVPVTYWKYTEYIKPVGSVMKAYDDVLVSNLGRVVLLNTTLTPRHYPAEIGGYSSVIVRGQKIRIHRAMACVFITPDKKYLQIPLTKLTVNHIDGVKANNFINNLEWMTNKENATHSRETGLNSIWNEDGLKNPVTRPLLGRVVVQGRYKGLEFVVMGYRDAVRSGFHTAFRVAQGKVSLSMGCDFKFITKEECLKYKHFTELSNEEIEFLKLSTKEKENYQ